MPDPARTLPDQTVDDVAHVLRKLNARTGWTRGAARLLDELVALLVRKQYFRFRGSPSRYRLQRIGESYLYAVPANQTGHLARFRDQTVRIVCVSSGTLDRTLMAGPAGSVWVPAAGTRAVSAKSSSEPVAM